MLSVNLDAAFVISQLPGKHMVERAIKGRMLIITSLHAGSPRNLPRYSAAKAGQTMLVAAPPALAGGIALHNWIDP
jgi:3-oxoacyl-[acyl-carrier protein] reductase